MELRSKLANTWRPEAGMAWGYRKKSGRGRRSRTTTPTKISYGVIITRISKATRRPEAILVRGRYTDSFSEFVHGRYSSKNLGSVTQLLDKMSVHERLDIISLNFDQMWYRIWLNASKNDLFNRKCAKFHSSWMRDDGGRTLKRLVQTSKPLTGTDGTRLEFPKGRRRSSDEPDLNCAIRETREETRITKDDYRLIPDFRRVMSYVHMGVRYVNIYYAAVAGRDLRPAVDFRNLTQATEVADVRWMDIVQIRSQDTEDRRLERTIDPVFNRVKDFVRGNVPYRPPTFAIVKAPFAEVQVKDAAAHLEKLARRAKAKKLAESAPPPPAARRRRRNRRGRRRKAEPPGNRGGVAFEKKGLGSHRFTPGT
jgi:8-oxo-dGTP pyrophosphatase MutT (NUDIX family)